MLSWVSYASEKCLMGYSDKHGIIQCSPKFPGMQEWGKRTLGIHYGNQPYIFNAVTLLGPLNRNLWVHKDFNWFKSLSDADFRRIHSAYNSAWLLVPIPTTYLNRNNVVCLWKGPCQHHINVIPLGLLYRKSPRGFLCQYMALLIFLILDIMLVLSI